MEPFTHSEFENFFSALHGYSPMAWQVRLAERACNGDWPEMIDLPTGAGKTACLDIAVFALACQADRPPAERTAPLRTFLVVDRRIVVDDAFRRARKIQKLLAEAVKSDDILGRVARRLLALQGVAADSASSGPDDEETDELLGTDGIGSRRQPIVAVQLRGGIYRDVSWARSATQPLLVTSTVDQVGSRLLFRGYGLSDSARPIHAALTACDSLIILDEAHVSKAFGQTLATVRAYQSMPKNRSLNPSSPALLPCEGMTEKSLDSGSEDLVAASIGSKEKAVVTRPLVAVEMTATPSREVAASARFGLTTQELSDTQSTLGKRRFTSKPVELRIAEKATGKKAQMALATELAELASSLVSDQRRAVAIVVNRVATAKTVYQLLLEKVRKQGGNDEQVELMIGRMRPLDRDAQATRLRNFIASDTPADHRPQQPLFVVATQCIEVGADLDFDAMISEAAPLDALRQRFGRLNRTGRYIETRGMVVIQAAQAKSDHQLDELEKEKKLDDPVYGNALARTWNRLSNLAKDDGDQRVIDFGIAAADAWVGRIDRDQLRTQLVTGSPDAPILFPAHLDLLCQTSPAPAHDPDVSLWLHGPRRSSLEVNVCWRDDLESLAPDAQRSAEDASIAARWLQAVSLCPPSSLECMPVPLTALRDWFTALPKATFDSADVAEQETEESHDETAVNSARHALVWRGLKDSFLLEDVGQLRPGDTVVFPSAAGGWTQLGHVPQAPPDPAENSEPLSEETRASIDLAELGFEQLRQRKIARIFGYRVAQIPAKGNFEPLRNHLNSDEFDLTRRELRELVADFIASELCPNVAFWESVSRVIAGKYQVDRYGDNVTGVVLKSLRKDSGQDSLDEDNGEDELSERGDLRRVSLQDHTSDVVRNVSTYCQLLGMESAREPLKLAAQMHDWGKCDPRFQAMLIRGDLSAAWRQPRQWAKSDRATSSRAEREAARRRAGLPEGFRHEMLSMQMAEQVLVKFDPATRDLVLHLIASHHGFARPWAPICNDPDSIDIEFEDAELPIRLSAPWRLDHVPEGLGSGVVERFWRTVRQSGWWEAAFLEMLLRLADHSASANPSQVVELADKLEEVLA